MLDFSKAEIEAIIQGIYNGDITDEEIPENLYFAIADYLKEAVYTGFGGSLANFSVSESDYDLLNELRENIYMFSAAKSYQQVREMTDALITDDGVIRSFPEFRKIADGIFDKYNVNWLQAEYNTAIGQATMARKWNKIQEDKKVLPLLKYDAVNDEVTCEICGPLDGVVAPVDDPLWDQFMPLNHFNCRCLVQQLEDGADKTPNDKLEEIEGKVKGRMKKEFLMNPGKDRVIFNKEHPYFEVAPKDKDLAKQNFGLPIPEPTAKEKGFVDANSLTEVASRLKQIGVLAVNLRGLDLPEANAVLRAFHDESQFAPLKIGSFETFKAPKSTAQADYLPFKNRIRVNLSRLETWEYQDQSATSQIERLEADAKYYKDNYLGNPAYSLQEEKMQSAYNRILKEADDIRQKVKDGEAVLPWSRTSLQKTRPDAVRSMMTHELAHYRHFRTPGLLASDIGFDEKLAKKEMIPCPSNYSKKDKYEYFAEWFTKYRQEGAEGVPEELLKLFKKIEGNKP